ncbi:amyloid beta precursor protein binding family B member 1-like isoform X2 [Tubulanus polymorphus]|uniref:amyloid beta precursor protein binding family B member 1-like isoform X2 n=1 Tax=Tubulanus polymorphus TaxID=672921 RepID=UPI003DA50B4E
MTLQNRNYLIAKARYLRLTRKLNSQMNNLNNMFWNGTLYRNRRWEQGWEMDNNPLYDNETFTSFSNPNYQLNEDDALNSNIASPITPTSVQYYEGQLYDDISPDILSTTRTSSSTTSNNTSKRRRNYAQLDIKSMGINLTDPSSRPTNCSRTRCGDLKTPDSVCSIDSQRSDDDSLPYADDSSLAYADESASDRQTVECSNNQETDDDLDCNSLTPSYAETKSGFLGYYASLEKSLKAAETERHREAVSTDESEGEDDEDVDDDDDEDEVEEQEKEERADERTRLLPPETNVNQTDTDKSNNPESFSDKTKCINSPDSNDSGIQADHQGEQRELSSHDLYQLSLKSASTAKVKLRNPAKTATNNSNKTSPTEDNNSAEPEAKEELPPGWQKHEDENGPYYWHIKSGTIQRDPPSKHQRPLSIASDISISSTFSSLTSPTFPETPGSCTSGLSEDESDHLNALKEHAFNYMYASESLRNLYTPSDDSDASCGSDKSEKNKFKIRFAVRSLGWVKIAEEDLTSERSSKAVNKCIVDLSLGRNDINDVVGRWGDGKDLYMDLDNSCLTLIDPQDETVLNKQVIQSIRVWGVGRDNGRDFAYVARDKVSRKHMCHVFRCDTPAREIANTLRDICKKLMYERSMRHGDPFASAQRSSTIRPNNLPNLEKNNEPNGQSYTFQSLYKKTSFPTPMEEPKKVIRAHYVGQMQVSKPTGVDILNDAMQSLYNTVPPEEWVFVNVGVAPSTLTVTENANPDNQICECRVRFLSFMGIAMQNVKLCAFIMHSAQGSFVAHVFHCEPSAGALCKTIEAACKLRYQKCLDSHPTTPDIKRQQMMQSKAGLRASLKAGVQNVFGMFKSRKTET